ncbi:MAG: hypothetical protein ACM3WP_05045 [Acidobacteriota bacterium]
MGWQANHYYAIPTVILGGEGSFYNLSSVNDEDSGCWDLLSKHYGDAKLPLSLPKGPMAIPIIFYGVLVLAVPLYCLLAFRWTGVSVMKNVTIKIREYVEGDDATENFEQGMKALFSVPKEDVVKAEKKKKQKRRASSRAESVRKPHPSDKD